MNDEKRIEYWKAEYKNENKNDFSNRLFEIDTIYKEAKDILKGLKFRLLNEMLANDDLNELKSPAIHQVLIAEFEFLDDWRKLVDESIHEILFMVQAMKSLGRDMLDGILLFRLSNAELTAKQILSELSNIPIKLH